MFSARILKNAVSTICTIYSATCIVAAANTLDLYSVISCNSSPNKQYFQQEFARIYGPPIRDAEGALWYRGTGEMYDSPIKEVFVSNTFKMSFVGVVLESRPTDLIQVIPAFRLYPTIVHPNNGYWVGADGRQIMWHKGRYTKMFCSINYSPEY